MSNNMVDKNVSDKVVWENGVTHDNDFTPTMSQPQSEFHSQPQMMFCYKCNNVIPADSKCCPYCQMELYVTCPKCGARYSSQYPACNQCGTNRLEYIETQRREKEKIEARKQEEKLRYEKLELEKLEKERKVNLERWRREETNRRDKELIKATQEFKDAYAYLCELTERKNKFNKEQNRRIFRRLKFIGTIWIIGLIFYNHIPESVSTFVLLFPLLAFLSFIGIKYIKDTKTLHQHCPQTRNFNTQLTQEIVNRVSEYIATQNIDLKNIFQKEHLDEEVVKAYKALGGSIVRKQ